MDNILEKLVEADKQAQSIVEEAEEYLETTMANIERDVKEYQESYTERAQRRIGIIRDEEGKASQVAAEDILKRYDQLMEGLEETYQAHHAQWEDELFNKCIGR